MISSIELGRPAIEQYLDPMFGLTLEMKRDQNWKIEDDLASLQEWAESAGEQLRCNNEQTS